MKHYSRFIGGILLVSGTTIGAGMLALPVSTGMAGFFPSLLLFIAYWIYMTFTAFLILEVNLWRQHESNLTSMAGFTLGKIGQVISWIIYLFLLYSLTTAYIAGGSPIVLEAVKGLTGMNLPEWTGTLPLLFIFGFFVYKGTRSVDYVNRLLMLGLVIAYIFMMLFLTPHVETELLSYVNWNYVWMGASVVATSFGFHIIIPSLVIYLDRDIKRLKHVILIGSLIPLVVYISWEFLALGIIPVQGPSGIAEGYANGSNGAHLLTAFIHQPALALLARLFSFCAIVTSFLGVSLSLSHCLADGLSMKKTRSGRLLLFILTFLPPLLITLIDPRAFLSALEYAGAFGVVTLLGLLPALMVWSGRYIKNLAPSSSYRAPGGKVALIFAIILSLTVIGVEIFNKI